MPTNEKRHPAGEPGAVSGLFTKMEQEIAHPDDTSVIGQFASAPTDPDQLAIDLDPEINAHTLADRGLPVFPAAAKNQPLVKWRSAATTDHADISRWWRHWPDALVAVALPPGRLVIDADMYKRAAQDTMTRLESKYGPLPACPTVATPRGGRHYYFGVSRDIRFADVAGPGVDLRAGDRNYVLAPPSRVGDRRYEWLTGEFDDPPELPLSWLAGVEHRRPMLRTTRHRILPAALTSIGDVSLETVTLDDLGDYLDALPRGRMDRLMARAVDPGTLAVSMRKAAHDTLTRVSYRVIALAAEGHPGGRDAVQRVIVAFAAEIERRLHAGEPARAPDEIAGEVVRAIAGAIVKVSAE
ncbi:bifunctional DNA primase/polymerase [Gordonia McavH-238-E]|uniref:bifunctional DNA primase/polymerase n=1 Tax=Gordonia sp. McavH-238-E TaxID=2917736 RepID=UPI001EF56B6C|nr:bifunctional DNA primase/polymerase [Gordonia sp. McavH-238-E]MCG7631129.1 bifunctional DNA primase/polymerase [Gordonia sp. McavH-238-E]